VGRLGGSYREQTTRYRDKETDEDLSTIRFLVVRHPSVSASSRLPERRDLLPVVPSCRHPLTPYHLIGEGTSQMAPRSTSWPIPRPTAPCPSVRIDPQPLRTLLVNKVRSRRRTGGFIVCRGVGGWSCRTLGEVSRPWCGEPCSECKVPLRLSKLISGSVVSIQADVMWNSCRIFLQNAETAEGPTGRP
jgi:hypothetical protein